MEMHGEVQARVGRRRAETRRRLVAGASALAGLVGVVALIIAWQVLDPGRAGADPQPSLTQATLGRSLRLTAEPVLQFTAWAMGIGMILILVFACQLAARLGQSGLAPTTAAAFTVGIGVMTAMLFVVEYGVSLGLGETGLEVDRPEMLLGYFMWQWWVARFAAVVFVCLMLPVVLFGVRDIVLARTARWATLVGVLVIVALAIRGWGAFPILVWGPWVAGMSVAMALHAVRRPSAAAAAAAAAANSEEPNPGP